MTSSSRSSWSSTVNIDEHPETAGPPPHIPPGDSDTKYLAVVVGCRVEVFTTAPGAPPTLQIRLYRQKQFITTLRQFWSDALGSFQTIISRVRFPLPQEFVERIATRALDLSREAVAGSPSARVVHLRVLLCCTRFLTPAVLNEILLRRGIDMSSRAATSGGVPGTEASLESLEYVEHGDTTGGEKELKRCSICLKEFDETLPDDEDEQNDWRIVRTQCLHEYHKHCIVQWLEKNHTCPLCRCDLPLHKV